MFASKKYMKHPISVIEVIIPVICLQTLLSLCPTFALWNKQGKTDYLKKEESMEYTTLNKDVQLSIRK